MGTAWYSPGKTESVTYAFVSTDQVVGTRRGHQGGDGKSSIIRGKGQARHQVDSVMRMICFAAGRGGLSTAGTHALMAVNDWGFACRWLL